MLRILNYRKAYGSATVLQIETLELPPGIYWLKGENGTGKTTLLKSIAGLIPFDGTIEVDSINLRKQRMLYTRVISFAEAEPVYPSFLTGTDLLQFYLNAKGSDKAMIDEMAKAFGISYLQNKVDTYSSGMLKKLSLLLAFVGKPKLILLDEPFITLDAKAVETLQRYICQRNDNGVSFLLSSHQEFELDNGFNILRIHHQTIQREVHVTGA